MFEELVVFDLSTVLAGPSVATFFAELGAKVTKIEHPEHGDVTRTWRIPGESQEVTSYFSSINYGKDYLCKDLSQTADFDWLMNELKRVDVLIMNFKPIDYTKFNLSKEALLAINPRLIIGSISGFGDDSDRIAYDLILQAETGFMSMNGEANHPPLKMPVALIDVLAAHHLKEGLLLALMKLQKTGKGSWVSVSLYNAAVASLVNQASAYLMNGLIPKQIGSLHPNIAPYGEVFTTKDDKLLTFAIGSNRQFKALCAVLNCAELADNFRYISNEERVRNRSNLSSELAPFVSRIEAETLEALCHEHHIPVGIIKSLDEVFSTPNATDLIRQELQGTTHTQRMSQLAFKWK